MATPTFKPVVYSNVANTPTATLGVATYTIRATFFDPTKRSHEPLPRHIWGLYHSTSKKFVSVASSDKQTGQCVIMSPQTLPPGQYTLQVFPFPDATQAPYITSKEAWIDLDSGDWLDPALVPQAGTPMLLKRKVLRIPVWTTDRKAKVYGGKFSDAPSNTKDFDTTGILRNTDITPYGTASKPWDMQLDFGWIRSHIRYFFVDWKAGEEETAPPGLLVEVTDDAGNRLGAGGAIDPKDGTAYVLVAAPPKKWKSLHVGFAAPPGTRVDLTAADAPLTADGRVPADPNTRVTLPSAWHSLGQNAQYARTPGGTNTTSFKTWDELRKTLAADDAATEPLLTFHLNDVALVRGGKLVTLPDKSRITMFDHLLAIRKPDPDRPHLTLESFKGSRLAARRVFTISPDPPPSSPTTMRDLGTRLINHQGTFFDLEESFVSGKPGTTPLLGARAAVAGAHAFTEYSSGCKYMDGYPSPYELHVIPVPFVKDPVTKLELTHALVYVGSLVLGKSDLAKKKDASWADPVSDFYSLLTIAAVRWSQGHPGVDKHHQQKDYRVVSRDTGKRSRGLIRLRFFFGERTDNQHKLTVQLKLNPMKLETGAQQKVEIQVRASTDANMRVMSYYDLDVRNDFGNVDTPDQDLDNATGAQWNVLAHEFGHVLGLPDEYYETLDPPDPTFPYPHPQLPRYAQYAGWKSGVRPYWQDFTSIMLRNRLLRLRHVWQHVAALNDDAKFAFLQDRPFVLRHDSYPNGGLEYVTPAGKAAPAGQPAVAGNRNNPYTPLFRGDLPFANVVIFPVGEDEGTVEAMFSPPGDQHVALPAGARFDAIVVVRSYLRLVFSTKITMPKQWGATRSLQLGYYNKVTAETIRFQLVGGTLLKRMAVVFHPHYVGGIGAGKGWTGADPTHLRINIMATAVAPAKNRLLADSPGKTLTLGLPDINTNTILRLILGVPTWTAGPGAMRTMNTASIAAADFGKLAAKIDSLLGDTPGTRTVQPL